MIEIEVTGLGKLGAIKHFLNIDEFQNMVTNIVYYEVWLLAEKIRNDPEIPQDYKDAMFISPNKETGKVTLAVFIPSKMKWARWGRVVEWEGYKCPIRKYYGGELTPEYSGPDYIKQKFATEKPKMISNIKAGIVNKIKSWTT